MLRAATTTTEPTQSTSRDDVLLGRIAEGCEQSFGEIFDCYQVRVFRFSFQMTGSQEMAEDVTQEVFLSLLRRPNGFRRHRGPLSAYLIGAARNLVYTEWRKRKHSVSLLENGTVEREQRQDPNAGNALDEILRKQDWQRLQAAILALPESYREAVVLCDLEEMKYEEAAQALQCAVGTIRSRLSRGRALLVEKLRGKEPADA
jgi:RNA polymerase sigma-70 factor (ECF subfamily)